MTGCLKRSIAIGVSLLVLLCLAGCGKKTGMTGIWGTVTTLGKTDAELAETEVGSVKTTVTVVFDPDGTMETTVAIDREEFRTAFKRFLATQIGTVGENGDLTEEQFKEMTGTTFEAYAEDAMQEVLPEFEGTTPGFYRLENGRLQTREKEEDDWKTTGFEQIGTDEIHLEINGTTLTLSRKKAK